MLDKNKNDKMQTLGDLLKEARERKVLLLRQVAAGIDVDTAMISKFEKGERKPTREQVVKLAKALEVDEKLLLTHYLSEKVLDEIQQDELAGDALKMAEAKISFFKKKRNK